MGMCDTWNVGISILLYENGIFSLPKMFHFNNLNKIYLSKVQQIHFFLNFGKVLSEPH